MNDVKMSSDGWVTDLGPITLEQVTSRLRRPREVLDLHADLHRTLARPDAWLTECMKDYALRDIGVHPEWGASHLNPSTSLDDLGPWMHSLGTDLFGATTFQVTAEMVDLADALRQNTPDLSDIVEEDLPADWGFMWFDKPVPRPSCEDEPGQQPLMMHAVSWAKVPAMAVLLDDGRGGQFHVTVPAIRVREWGFNDDPRIRPNPLHLMGQTTVPLNRHIHTPLPELWLVHMVWILMGMEITASRTEYPDRHGAKRAKELRHAEIRVITLRRPARGASEKPSATPRHIDWSCTWLVRGHYRKAPHGATFSDGRAETWVRPYIKGPDGAPLRAPDILWRLSQ